MTFSKKHTAIPLSLILICIIVRGFLIYSMSIAPLAAFCKELAMDSLTDNPFELHYTIAYPEEMGFENLSNNLIPFNESSYTKSKEIWMGRAETLTRISSAYLNKEDSFLHDLLSRYVNLQLESLEFPYYENPLSCSGGIHSQLPILLSEYAFRCKEDVENYFLLLSQIPAYFEGIAEYTQMQEINGICIYQGSLQEVQAQCLELFPKEQLKNNTHFLQTSFQKRMQDLVSQNIITEQEAADYELRNNTLLLGKVAPAYEALAASVGTLKGTPQLAGLSAYPKGKEYYALLLAANTGSSKSVPEIQSMLYEQYDMLYSEYTALLENGTFMQNWKFPIKGHSDMLEHLYEQAQEQFPVLSLVAEDTVQQVQLKNVDGILASMSAPAFYMTPPIDDNAKHTIYINPDAEMQSLDLYTTLAHEGFPGHLYQTVYSQTALSTSHEPLIRQLLYYGGFTEGWAVYAELYSYNFLAAACDEKLTDTLALTRLNREIQLCLCSILDIFIHYEGAGLQEVEQLLKTLGLNSSSAKPIYEAICDAPANYPKYYVGYLEILNLKDSAKELWNDAYSDYNFHKWLLETGPADFGSLAKKLATSTSPSE